MNRYKSAYLSHLFIYWVCVWRCAMWGHSIDGHKLCFLCWLKMKEYNRIKCEQFDFLAPLLSRLMCVFMQVNKYKAP